MPRFELPPPNGDRRVIRSEPAGRMADPAPFVEGAEQERPTANGGETNYWKVFRRRKLSIIAAALAGLAAAVLVTLPQTPEYRAKMVLEIQPINDNFLNMRDVNPVAPGMQFSPEYEMQTDVKVLTNTALIDRVVRKLNVDSRPLLASGAHRAEALKKLLHLPVRERQPLAKRILSDAESALNVRALTNTRLIEVTYDSTDPQFAADFANALGQEFIEQNLEARWQTTQHTEDWLNRQMQELRVKLTKSEDQLQSYARASGLLFTDEKDNVADEKLKQLQTAYSEAQADRVAKQSRYELAASASADSVPEVLDDKTLQSYQVKLTDLRREMAELSSTMTPAHPRVEKVKAQIEALETASNKERGDILRRIRNEYEAARRRERLLADEYDGHVRLMSAQAAKVSHYNLLRREVDSTRQLYESLLQRVKEAGVASALRASNVRIVEPASPPTAPYRPKLPLNAAFGLVGGLAAGFGLAIMRERSARSILEPGDAQQFLNVCELGVIPSFDTEKSLHRILSPAPKPGKVLTLLPGSDPVTAKAARGASVLADSFQATLTSILFSGENGARPGVLVISSANPGEGKTTVACNLAVALAGINLRVLLIDGDFRKPKIHTMFDVENTAGFADVLADQSTVLLDSAIRRTNVTNLHVLPSGPASSPNTLYSPRLAEMIQAARDQFDIVLIDTPPMLQMPDARVLGRYADGVVLVVRSDQTTQDAAVLACERFLDDGTRVLGAILNDWNPKRSNFYAYTESYDRYTHYYRKEA